MRYLFVTPSLHVSGVERWFLTLARHTRKFRPHAILLLGQRQTHPGIIEEAERLCPVILAEDFGSQRAIFHREMRHCEVAITWSFPGDLRELMIGADKPLVLVSHVSEELNQVIHRNAPCATHFAAVSEVARQAFPDRVRDRAVVLPNGSDMERSAPRPGARERLRSEWGVGDRTVVLFLGRIAPEKRPEMLLSAVHELGENYVAVFCGSGPSTQKVADVAAKIPELVLVSDSVLNPSDLLAACDVVAVPSRYESFCLTILEAWFARKPVAATPFPAAEELVAKHGDVLFLAHNMLAPKSLANAIRQAAMDDGAMTERAFQAAFENYTATAMAARWDDYLEGVVRSHRPWKMSPVPKAPEKVKR